MYVPSFLQSSDRICGVGEWEGGVGCCGEGMGDDGGVFVGGREVGAVASIRFSSSLILVDFSGSAINVPANIKMKIHVHCIYSCLGGKAQ